MNKLASALTGLGGERVALCDVSVSAVLQDLLAEVAVSQTYRNDERVNIEAVYTFPLPLDAVLLELEVEIGGRLLKGVVVEKKAAEGKYEDAVEAGDAAVMLEAIEPGLFTMNVGNLLPQETAKITFRYAILYRWAGDRLRFFLPTTIAPRFGESPHLPHQAPKPSLTVENQFSLRVEVRGALRDAQFVCPSHAIELVKSPEGVVLSLSQPNAVMDRDFVLNVKAPQATRSFVLCGQDGVGLAAVASFQPFFPGLQQPRPLNLAIVIDCSGSMQGDSMEQAKQALEGILDGLQPHDRIALIAFGNSTNVLSDRPLPCNKTNLAKAKRFAKALDANMGGTEIGNALREAYAVAGRSESADVFLMTDGEVSDWETVVDDAKKSGHRIFTVGVGSAVSEAFVRELAAVTGGVCELVSPREGMADRVVRHFERMRAPRAKRVAVRWPDGAANITPARIGAVFEGDTVVACARFDRAPAQGAAILEVETDKGETVRQELAFPATTPTPDGLSTVARVAAAARLKELDDGVGLETALRYRLVSPWTNWLVIAPRTDEEKAQDLPALRKVPQTLAAGWGGVGSVAMSLSMDALAAPRAMYSRSVDFAAMEDFDLSEIETPRRSLPLDLPEPYRRLLELVDANASRLDVAGALDLLTESGLAAEFDDLFRHTADLGLSVDVVAAIVLARLLGGPLGEPLSGDAQVALASLQERAREATDALQQMGRHGVALARLTQEPAAREVLRRRSDGEDLERFARMRELLDHLDEAVRRSGERLQHERARHAHREGGAIA
ncbi:MAG: VWA domain-containing protein [Candidatus Accumulibacter similis]|nr:MAG: VWA domain-containing protein [Candidatus Accumulibacter similis]